MSALPAGIYQRAITHDDASCFKARMKRYAEQVEQRKAAADKLRTTVATLKQRRQA